jgi:putative peptide zinc metalloprotease protein
VSAHPRLRPDLVLVEQTYRGEQSYIVKDPQTRKYFRFRPLEVSVMQLFDGRRTGTDTVAALAEQGIRVTAATVEKFAAKLRSMGLCERTLQERSVLQMERLRAERQSRLRRPIFKGDMFRLRWSVADPDKFLDRCMPYLRFCFTRAFLAISLALFGAYFLVLALKWPEFWSAMVRLYHFDISGGALFRMWLVMTIIIVIHELGHAFTCKYFGGQVHEIGVMLIYFELAFFCNVNDAWTFPGLKPRLWVTASGSWIQMVLASMGAILWWAATPGSLASEVGLDAVLFGGIFTVLVNINPLIPLDGYFALSDYLEVPNLRHRALGYLGWLVKTRIFRLDAPEPPADERERRIFLIYGALAMVYITTIFAAFAGAVYGWLDRLLGTLGIVIFVVGVFAMLRSKIREWSASLGVIWRRLSARWRERRRRDRLVLVGAAVLVLGTVLPRPITVVGGFSAAPALSIPLSAPDSGLVERVYVREGTRVAAGAPLLEVRNLDLERAALAAGRSTDSVAARVTQARAAGRNGEAARLEADLATGRARLSGLLDQRAGLTIRAPSAGVVVTPRPEELGGQWVDLGQPIMALGSPDLELRILVDGAGSSLVRPGQPVRFMFYADRAALRGRIAGVAAAATDSRAGAVEARVAFPADESRRAGMTGEASITIRRSNVWGSLFWAIRRRIRTDILL